MRKTNWVMIATIAVVLTTAAGAQVQTTKSVDQGQPKVTTSVERGEVVHVSGNEIMVKMEDGTLRNFKNIPDSATATVDGRELTVRELKAGMKLQRTITTTATPQVVTTVQTVTGKVFFVSPPNSVILTLEDGTNQQFTIPKDQKFKINGNMVDAFHLRKGMTVSATKIVEVPESVVASERRVRGTMPPPPAPPAADEPILIVRAAPAPKPAPHPAAAPTAPVAPTATAPVPEAAAPAELPKAGSDLPLVGMLGAFCLALAGGLRFLIRRPA